MKSELYNIALWCILLGLYGCGLKGSLYSHIEKKVSMSEQKQKIIAIPPPFAQSSQTTSSDNDRSGTAIEIKQPKS